MFKRKLSALNYPNTESFNTNDEKELRRVIVWLEENKIKKCKPGIQKNILNIDSEQWKQDFDKYKQDLACPVTNNILIEDLDWLIRYALKQEYNSNKQAYEKHVVQNLQSNKTPNIVADNPLDHLDFSSKDFESGIRKLAELLKVSPHPDPLITLNAVSKVVCNRLNQNALKNPQDYIIKGTPFPFQDTDLGFDLGDAVLNRAAKVLRLLYIHNLRDLQTKANELIVAVQSITANPKTDTKLGKVGK